MIAVSILNVAGQSSATRQPLVMNNVISRHNVIHVKHNKQFSWEQLTALHTVLDCIIEHNSPRPTNNSVLWHKTPILESWLNLPSPIIKNAYMSIFITQIFNLHLHPWVLPKLWSCHTCLMRKHSCLCPREVQIKHNLTAQSVNIWHCILCIQYSQHWCRICVACYITQLSYWVCDLLSWSLDLFALS